jgi:poly(3-hydroxybutyrate) depolymerase
MYSPRMTRVLTVCAAALLVSAAAGAADKMTKETFISGGKTRTYYLLVPEAAKKAKPAPLLVLLHGSGRDGKSLLEKWEPLAKKEGIILVGPDAISSDGWRVPQDGPEFLYDLISMLEQQLDVDPRRVYLFGHSAGAGHALVMAVLESQYLAAVAVHAGAMHESMFPYIERAQRQTPIAIWVGTNDALFPLKVVRATRDAFKAQGFEPELTEIPGHTHWYYDRAPEINKKVWTFLKQYSLTEEPKYER